MNNKCKHPPKKALIFMLIIAIFALTILHSQNVSAEYVDAQCVPQELNDLSKVIMTNLTEYQTITLSADNITKIQLHIAKTGTPTSNLNISLYNGKPWDKGTQDVREISVVPGDITEYTSSWDAIGWYEWNFTDFQRNYTSYTIELYSDTPWDYNNCYEWEYDNDNIYADGNVIYYNEGSYTNQTDDDAAFKIYGEDDTDEPPYGSDFYPADNAINISFNPTLKWINVIDPEGNNTVVTFYDASDDSVIGTDTVASGNNATTVWDDLFPGTTYQWYVTLDDGYNNVTSSTVNFTTRSLQVLDSASFGGKVKVEYNIIASASFGGKVKVGNNLPSVPPTEYPSNGATNIDLTPNCHIAPEDGDGDILIVKFYGYNNSNSSYYLDQINESVSPGNTVYWIYSNATDYETLYNWSVKVSDGYDTITKYYNFTTKSSAIPFISEKSPSNGSTGIGLTPQIWVIGGDADEDLLTMRFYENNTGSWVLQQINESMQPQVDKAYWTYDNATVYNTTYWWKINISDGYESVEKIYHFTTLTESENASTYPTITLIIPSNNSDDKNISFTLQVFVNDTGHYINWTKFYWSNDTLINNTFWTEGNEHTDSYKFCNATGLDYNATYGWYVKADDGGLTTTSPAWYFTTTLYNHHPTVSLVSPDNNSEVNVSYYESGYPKKPQLKVYYHDDDGHPGRIEYYCGSSPSAMSYVGFDTNVVSGTIATYILSTDEFQYNTTNYWKVNYVDFDPIEEIIYEWQNNSYWWTFNTTEESVQATNHCPYEPVLQEPYNNAIVDVSGLSSYDVIFKYQAYDPDFSLYAPSVYNDSLTVKLYVSVNGGLYSVINSDYNYRYDGASITYAFDVVDYGNWIDNGKTFLWYVTSTDEGECTNISEIYNFTVVSSVIQKIGIIGPYPANNSVIADEQIIIGANVMLAELKSCLFEFYGKQTNGSGFSCLKTISKTNLDDELIYTYDINCTWQNLQNGIIYSWYIKYSYENITGNTSIFKFTVNTTNVAPIIFNEYPPSNSTNVAFLPVISIWISDIDSPELLVTFYDSDDTIIHRAIHTNPYYAIKISDQWKDVIQTNHTYQWYVEVDDNDGNVVRYPSSGYLNFTTGVSYPPMLSFHARTVGGYPLAGVNITCMNINEQNLQYADTDSNGFAVMSFNYDDIGKEYVFTFSLANHTTITKYYTIYTREEYVTMKEKAYIPDGGDTSPFDIFTIFIDYAKEHLTKIGLLFVSLILIIASMLISSKQFNTDFRTNMFIGVTMFGVFVAIGWIPFWLLFLPLVFIALLFGKQIAGIIMPGRGDES